MGLLATVLDGLFDAGWFSDRTLADLLDFRDADESERIDSLSGASSLSLTPAQRPLTCNAGVNFNTSPSFAMATILVKGLRFSPIAEEMSSLLIKFLLCTRNLDPTVAPVGAGLATHADDAVADPRRLDRESTPYFLALLPYFARTGRMDELLELAGLDDVLSGGSGADSQTYAAVAARLSIDDDDTATLAFAFLVALARVADTDSEYLSIFTVMAWISHSFPSAANCLCVLCIFPFRWELKHSFPVTKSPSPSSTTSSTSAKALSSSMRHTPSSPLSPTTLREIRRARIRCSSGSGLLRWRRGTPARLRWRSFAR